VNNHRTFFAFRHNNIQYNSLIAMVSIQRIVDLAIDRFGGARAITIEQLVDIVGLTAKERAFVIASWALIYTDEWRYLSDELILNHLTEERGADTIQRFIDRELIAKFIYERDYVQVTRDGKTINQEGIPTAYADINFRLPNLASGNVANKDRHFVVSPGCIKQLLLSSSTARGSETMSHFVKLEKLATMMREYTTRARNVIREREMARIERERRFAIEEAAKEHANRVAAESRVVQLRQLASIGRNAQLSEYVYVATTPLMGAQNHYKIGRCASPSARIRGYNTGRPEGDDMHYVRTWQCYNAKGVEQLIKSHFSEFAERKNREVFNVGIHCIIAVIDIFVRADAAAADYTRDFLQTFDPHAVVDPNDYKEQAKQSDESRAPQQPATAPQRTEPGAVAETSSQEEVTQRTIANVQTKRRARQRAKCAKRGIPIPLECSQRKKGAKPRYATEEERQAARKRSSAMSNAKRRG
jgi:hypothetical protein